MLKFSDDEKLIIKLIVNKYKDSLVSCSDKNELAEIGYKFAELVTCDFSHVYFCDLEGYATIVFCDERINRSMSSEQQLQLSNEYSPKHIRILQRIYFIKNLIDSRLIVMNNDPCPSELPEIEDTRLALRFPVKEESISNFIKEYHEARMLPTFELEKIFKNNFKDDEQIRYENQLTIANTELNIAKKQLKKANCSIIISIFGLIIAVVVPCLLNTFTTNKINNEQIIEVKNSLQINQKEISNRLDTIVDITKHHNHNIGSERKPYE